MESKKILHNVFQNIEVGIGEVSKVVGVSQRQLRLFLMIIAVLEDIIYRRFT